MTRSLKIMVFPVKDPGKAKAFYSKILGVEPYVDSTYYIGYHVGDFEVGLDPNSRIGPIGYVDVEDIKVTLEEMKKLGAEVVRNVSDVANGLLVAKVKDADGNVLGLRQQT